MCGRQPKAHQPAGPPPETTAIIFNHQRHRAALLLAERMLSIR
ncbi:hypothetical protein SynNOUM97013_02259 [Synechococcus sp. NOUM97013]|nr:hypothetical protein SynNOUM97013_02259 [Synechococcus sp. NOUM97013]